MATQVAGEMYYEIDGQLVEIKRQLRQPNGYPFDPVLLKIALQNAIEGKFVNVRKQPLFSIGAQTILGAVIRKSTKKCLIGPRWGYRGNLDTCLPVDQSNANDCVITTLAFSRSWTFVESTVAILGVGARMDTASLGKLLIARGHTMTLTQVEEMVEATERGEKTDMRTDGYENFFFVETGDSRCPVLVGQVRFSERVWCARVFGFDFDRRWCTDHRLFIRD